MNLTYQTKGSNATKEVRVQFDPPLAGYDEVKPRLIAMKAEAEEEENEQRKMGRAAVFIGHVGLPAFEWKTPECYLFIVYFQRVEKRQFA